MKSLSMLLAATLAAASPIIDGGFSMEKTVKGRAVKVTAADVDNMRFFAQYAAASYCNSDAAAGAAVACSANACPTVMSNKAVIKASLNGDTITNIDGYIAVDPTRSLIVVSYRGSASVRNWITNLAFARQSCSDLTPGCEVHTGFAAAWKDVTADTLAAVRSARAANPSYSVAVTGHSLGGAVATLAAAYLRKGGIPCDLYTYGSPRVGNEAFASFVSNQAGAKYRVTHLSDPVPRLPPLLLGYRHTTPEYWLGTGTSKTTSYTAADIKVCEGTAVMGCNAGGIEFDADAHLYYFQPISGCGSGGPLPLARQKREELSDAELAERLRMFALLDQQYAASLAAGEIAE